MKQTTITLETSSLLILRAQNSRTAWCPLCGAEVEMLDVSGHEISALNQLPPEVHRSESPDGAALLCLNSLMARVQTTKPNHGGRLCLPNSEKERL
jgi:hypothetical protein